MTILDALRFVRGSVAKKDFLPALTSFVIENGRVRGFNGTMALCSPIPFDIKCQPKADTLIKAIANCDDTVQLSLTGAGRLSVKAGKFKAFIDCTDSEPVHPLPEGQFIQLDGMGLLNGLKAVEPFIGSDAARQWAQGVLIINGSLFATNNVMLVQYWTGVVLPHEITLPAQAVKEMIRINEAPIQMQLADGNITFHYEGERWLRTQLYDSTKWPNLEQMLNRPSVQSPIEEDFFAALEVIKPFVDQFGTVIFQPQSLTTHTDDNEGASFEVPSLIGVEGKYNVVHLELLKGTAKTIDWTPYPSPCVFMNDRLRGLIVGMKK